ncbi:hypothetical protein B0A49_03411 [Cryomyces minteri]|uniref:Uncharacterized protein n=1 Tax=Cryomyces minteri TaxID=331657 RepID=A0A4U0XET3_9PEZI|nr:hypothetical protein B0A49_03411 [Cryomyces minteri]
MHGHGATAAQAQEKERGEMMKQSSESEYEDETAAERRVRLAESYIENIRREVVDEAGFDAADVDRDNIAARLKEDVAETKGRLYRRLASDLSFDTAAHTQFRADVQSYTGIATCPPYAYTVSKDMTLIKWEIQTPPTASDSDLSPTNGASTTTTVPPPPQQSRRRPKQLIFTKGNKNEAASPTYQHHTSSILCVAASADGRFVATGGQDRKLIIWAGATLSPLKVFPQHRDAVTSLAFRRGTNQLFSASADRTIKIWSLDELAYVDTLFGHQDAVVALAALGLERCVSVGARDRTARLWKVVEESQLVFRGGGSSVTRTNRGDGSSRPGSNNDHNRGHAEGSIDAVVLIDDETFVTGSDNGALSLWSVHKKKPLFSIPAAHGCDAPLAPDEASAERSPSPGVVGAPLPRWITALAGVPFSDVVVSGSWDGAVRAWRVSEDRRRLEALGPVGWLPPDDPDTRADLHADADATLHQPPPASGQLASATPHPDFQPASVGRLSPPRRPHASCFWRLNDMGTHGNNRRNTDGLHALRPSSTSSLQNQQPGSAESFKAGDTPNDNNSEALIRLLETSLTLIRRDPTSGAQWNVAKIRDPPVLDVSSESTKSQRLKRAGAPLFIDVYNPGYTKFIVPVDLQRGDQASPTSMSTAVSELRFNLPGSNLLSFPPTPIDDGSSSKRSSFFARPRVRENLSSSSTFSASLATPVGVINDDKLDLSLGKEHARGGFGGKQAKLGKLIIEDEGLKMLDLLVAANMSLWWRAYERTELGLGGYREEEQSIGIS